MVFSQWTEGVTTRSGYFSSRSMKTDIGTFFRKHIAQGRRIHIVSEETLAKAQAFFKKYGGRSVMIGRFVPLDAT